MVLLQRKLYFSKDPKGSNIFRVGGPNAYFCDFPGGSRPLSPLLIHTWTEEQYKTDRNRSLNMRTDKHAYAVLKRRIFDNEHCFATTRFIYFL